MPRLVVEYDEKEGKLLSDGGAIEYAKELVEKLYNLPLGVTGIEVKVTNNLVIEQLRLEVKERRLKHTDVVILFKGEELTINERGRLPKWPHGFCDHVMEILSRLM